METTTVPTYFNYIPTDSSFVMAGDFAFGQLLREPSSTFKNDKLSVFFDKEQGLISVFYAMDWLDIDKNKAITLPERLTNPLYGREELDNWIKEKAKNAPGIERIWEITARFPSLTKMLLEDRENEEMPKYFFESSAFTKRYRFENGSRFVGQLFGGENDLFYLNLTVL
jgi:hypothetical protein